MARVCQLDWDDFLFYETLVLTSVPNNGIWAQHALTLRPLNTLTQFHNTTN